MAIILAMIKKEFLQIRRDTRTLAILIFIPCFMLVMFGYALTFDVRNIDMGIWNEDISPQSRELVRAFVSSGYFQLSGAVNSGRECDEQLDREKTRVVMHIPRNWGARLIGLDPLPLQFLVDGSDPNTAVTVNSYITMIMAQQQREWQSQAPILYNTAQPGKSRIDPQPRLWYNPELKSAYYLIPGLIGFILMITAVISTSLSIVREKEKNTFEQIIVSPIHAYQYILGKLIPYIIISIIATIGILIVGHLLFGVGVKGSLLSLALVTLLFLFVCLGIGLFISSVTDSQQVAFMAATIISLLPTFLLSGFVFPIRNMPFFIQWVTYLVPARYYMVCLRDIMLKGSAWHYYVDQIAALFIYGSIILAISIFRLRRNLT